MYWVCDCLFLFSCLPSITWLFFLDDREFADPIVAERTLEFLIANKTKILSSFPTLIPQVPYHIMLYSTRIIKISTSYVNYHSLYFQLEFFLHKCSSRLLLARANESSILLEKISIQFPPFFFDFSVLFSFQITI